MRVRIPAFHQNCPIPILDCAAACPRYSDASQVGNEASSNVEIESGLPVE
jgi:hypothetical protein